MTLFLSKSVQWFTRTLCWIWKSIRASLTLVIQEAAGGAASGAFKKKKNPFHDVCAVRCAPVLVSEAFCVNDRPRFFHVCIFVWVLKVAYAVGALAKATCDCMFKPNGVPPPSACQDSIWALNIRVCLRSMRWVIFRTITKIKKSLDLLLKDSSSCYISFWMLLDLSAVLLLLHSHHHSSKADVPLPLLNKYTDLFCSSCSLTIWSNAEAVHQNCVKISIESLSF